MTEPADSTDTEEENTESERERETRAGAAVWKVEHKEGTILTMMESRVVDGPVHLSHMWSICVASGREHSLRVRGRGHGTSSGRGGNLGESKGRHRVLGGVVCKSQGKKKEKQRKPWLANGLLGRCPFCCSQAVARKLMNFMSQIRVVFSFWGR